LPKFTYTGLEERVFLYPKAFTVAPGEEIEADENPDPVWFDQKGRKQKSVALRAGELQVDEDSSDRTSVDEKE
jgi:hypothetical protein